MPETGWKCQQCKTVFYTYFAAQVCCNPEVSYGPIEIKVEQTDDGPREVADFQVEV